MRLVGRPAVDKLALAAALFIVAACGGGGEKQVTGLVLEAVERSLTEIELLRLRDEDGMVWEFSTQGPVGATAAHLRQHQLAGQRIVVKYREAGGRLIALEVKDAAGPGG